MADPAEKLQNWVIQELNVVSEGKLQKIPSTETLRCLTTGKIKKIWTYVFDHVQAEAKVQKIKRFLFLKQKLEEDQTTMPNLLNEKIDALRRAIDHAKEKQIYLKESISVIQDRVIDIEQDTQIIKQETLKFNQKFALLNLLRNSYEGKIKSLRLILNGITVLAKKNKLFPKTDLLSDLAETRTSEFLVNEIFCTLNDCVDKTNLSSIIMQDDNHEISLQNFSNALVEKDLFLPGLITVFKKLCCTCLDGTMNLSLQNELTNCNTHDENIQNKNLITQLQYCYISNCLEAEKTSKIISEVAEKKEKVVKILSDRLYSAQVADAFPLLEKLGENEMYAKSNKFLEEFLKREKSEANKILKKICLQKQKIKELQCIQNDYFKSYNMIVWLTSASEKTFQYILSDSARMFNLAHQDIFVELPLLRKYAVQMEQLLELERKMMWRYCHKKDIIKTFFNKNDVSTLSHDSQLAFGILPFHNVDKVYEKWYQMKVKVNENDIQKILFDEVYHPNNLKTFCEFLDNLKSMKQIISSAYSQVDYSFTRLDKLGNLFTEWWEQSAQFIPEVKHDGKPLKLWIDVLSVLPDF